VTRAKVIVFVCFLLAFAAGGAVGLALGRPRRQRDDRSWLTRELNLTPEQQEQMREIWAGAMSTSTQSRAAIQSARDKEIRALLTDEQQARYEQIMTEHARKLDELSRDRSNLFKEAQERTKQILTESQRQKYEEVMKSRGSESRRHRRGATRGPGEGATEAPEGHRQQP